MDEKMTEQRRVKEMSQPDKVKYLLNQMLFPSYESPVFNTDRCLDTGTSDSRTEPDQKSHFSFRGFSKRVLTYLPQIWGADPNAALFFAKHGWISTTGFNVHCSNCLATMDCSCFIQKPDVWILVARKGHEKLCRWTCIPSPDNFIRIPEDPKLTYENMLSVWRKIISLGSNLPSLSQEIVTDMDIDSRTVELFFKILEVPITDEGLSALVLGICGWSESTSEKSLHCNFCDRHIGLWNFYSIEDKKPQTKKPKSSSGINFKMSEKHKVAVHNISSDDTVLEESLESEDENLFQTTGNSSKSTENETFSTLPIVGPTEVPCQKLDVTVVFSRRNVPLESNIYIKKKLRFLRTFRNRVHKRVMRQNIIKRQTVNLIRAQKGFKAKRTLGNTSLFNTFAEQHDESYDSYDSESDSSLDSQGLQMCSKSNIQRINKPIDRKGTNNILMPHKGMSVNASQFEEFVKNMNILDNYDSESESSIDNEELQINSKSRKIQRITKSMPTEETNNILLPREGEIISEVIDNSNHDECNTGNLLNTNSELQGDSKLNANMSTICVVKGMLCANSVNIDSEEIGKQLACQEDGVLPDSHKNSCLEEMESDLICKTGSVYDANAILKDSDPKNVDKDDITNKDAQTLNYNVCIVDSCTTETKSHGKINSNIVSSSENTNCNVSSSENTNCKFSQEGALEESPDKTMHHAVNIQEEDEDNNTISNDLDGSVKSRAAKADTDKDKKYLESDVDDISDMNKVTETSLEQDLLCKTSSHESLEQGSIRSTAERDMSSSISLDGIKENMVNENLSLVNDTEINNVSDSSDTPGDCVLSGKIQPMVDKHIDVKVNVHGAALQNIKSDVPETSDLEDVVDTTCDQVEITKNGIASDSSAVERSINNDELVITDPRNTSGNVTPDHICNDKSLFVDANNANEKTCKATIILDESTMTANMNNLQNNDTYCDISKSVIAELNNESNNSVLKPVENGSGNLTSCKSLDNNMLNENTEISSVSSLETGEKYKSKHTSISVSGDEMHAVDDMNTSNETVVPEVFSIKSVTEITAGESNVSNSDRDVAEATENLDSNTKTMVSKEVTVTDKSVTAGDNVLLEARSNNSTQNSTTLDHSSKSVNKMKDKVDLMVGNSSVNQIVNNLTEEKIDDVKTSHIEVVQSDNNFTVDSTDDDAFNKSECISIDATNNVIKESSSIVVDHAVVKSISREIEMIDKGGTTNVTSLKNELPKINIVEETLDNSTIGEMEVTNECSRTNQSSEIGELVEEMKSHKKEDTDEQSTENNAAREMELADESFAKEPSLTGVPCDNSVVEQMDVVSEEVGADILNVVSAVSDQSSNCPVVSEMEITNEPIERNSCDKVSGSIVVGGTVDVNENVQTNKLNETSESFVTGQAKDEGEISVEKDQSNEMCVVDDKLISNSELEINESGMCSESVIIMEETNKSSNNDMYESDKNIELVESSVVLNETILSDPLNNKVDVEHLRMSNNNENSKCVVIDGRTIDKSESDEYVVEVPSDSDIEAGSQCAVLDCEVDMDDAIQQTIIISNTRACVTSESERVKNELLCNVENVTLSVVNGGEYSGIKNHPTNMKRDALCNDVASEGVTSITTEKTLRKRKLDSSEDIKESPAYKKIKWDSCNVKVDFHPVNEHRFWCIWRLDAMDELCRPNSNIAKKGWQQVLNHLKLGISMLESSHTLPEYFEELMKLGNQMDNW